MPINVGGANKTENKIRLCPNCHALTHKGKYKEDFLFDLKSQKEKNYQKSKRNINKNINDIVIKNDNQVKTETVIRTDNQTVIRTDTHLGIRTDTQTPITPIIVKDNIKDNIKTSPTSKVKTFDPHDISYLLSETLIDQIKRNLPNGKDVQNGNRKKTIQRWASDIDKMIRLDNRPVCDIWNMIIWCHYDDFWFKNILSGSKLRKQYDKLSAAITSEVRRKNRNKTQHQKLLEVGERWLQKQGMQDS